MSKKIFLKKILEEIGRQDENDEGSKLESSHGFQIPIKLEVGACTSTKQDPIIIDSSSECGSIHSLSSEKQDDNYEGSKLEPSHGFQMSTKLEVGTCTSTKQDLITIDSSSEYGSLPSLSEHSLKGCNDDGPDDFNQKSWDLTDSDGSPKAKRSKHQTLPLDTSSSESIPTLSDINDSDEFSHGFQNKTIDEPDEKQRDFMEYPAKAVLDMYQSFTTINGALKAPDILQVLLHPHNYPICADVPQYVQEPSAFLINADNLKDRRDIRADGNGVWSIKNKPKRRFSIDEIGNVRQVKKTTFEKNVYEVTRSYASHKHTPSFRRLIIELTGSPFVILQFYFIGQVVAVDVKPHGNKKSTDAPPHRRVAASTLSKVSDMALKKPKQSAKSILSTFIDHEGGLNQVEPLYMPRNHQQVANMKRKANIDQPDEVTEMLHQFDTQTDNFIRKVEIRPDFVVVIASNQQLIDLERFCTKEPFSILGIDPTFHFGDFDVTVTTYRHRLLQDNTRLKQIQDKSPVFVGPICIHKKKNTQTYYNFLSTLVAHSNDLRNIKAVGTDGETALTNGILMNFENAIQVRCFNHVKQNLKNKLKDIGVSKYDKTTILNDIFGIPNKFCGLVDSYTHEEMDKKIESLKEKWNGINDGFWSWFKKYEVENFKLHMSQSVRIEAGLPVGQTYTTNDNESMNSSLQRVCGKRQPLATFVKEIKEFIRSQESQVQLSIVQQGSYSLKPIYRDLGVELNVWTRLSSTERQSRINSVMKCKVRNEPTIPTVRIDPNSSTSATSLKDLSIRKEQSGIIDTPPFILEEMWNKASLLSEKTSAICEIPDLPNARRVTSLSNPKNCYLVEYCLKTGNTKCDCRLYKLHKICHHALAVTDSEDTGILKQYLNWRKAKGTNYKLTSAIYSELPKGAGKKPNERKNWTKSKPTTGAKSSSHQRDPFDITTDDSYVFRFMEKTKIMVCYGCGEKFRKSIATVPEPPKDVVLARREFRSYVDHTGDLKMSMKKAFVHYHIDIACIRIKDTDFKAQDIIITENFKQHVKKEHRDLISKKLGIYV